MSKAYPLSHKKNCYIQHKKTFQSSKSIVIQSYLKYFRRCLLKSPNITTIKKIYKAFQIVLKMNEVSLTFLWRFAHFQSIFCTIFQCCTISFRNLQCTSNNNNSETKSWRSCYVFILFSKIYLLVFFLSSTI